jgi:hypothetical protein
MRNKAKPKCRVVTVVEPTAPMASATKSADAMGWYELNAALLGADEAKLWGWLKDTARGGRLNRAMRVYGRLSAVRRSREVAELVELVAQAKVLGAAKAADDETKEAA